MVAPVRLTATALGLGLTAAASASTADIRVLHASPDAPNVDVRLNGSVAIPNLAFESITDYATLDAGSYDVEVVPAGAQKPVVIDTTLDLAADTQTTVVAVGTVDSIAPLVLADDNTIDRDNARVRFVHASPDAPPVDIALDGGAVVFGNVAFTEVGDYLTLAPGTYDLEVRIAGTGTVVLDLPPIPLDRATVYSVFATGLAFGTPGLNAVLAVDAVGDAELKVLHGSPDAPPVDVLVNDEVAIAGLSFGTFSGTASLPAGDYNVKVVPAGLSEPVVIDADVSLEPGESYTVVAADLLANIFPIVLENEQQTLPSLANVRFVHASPNAPAVDLALADGPVLFPFAEFGDATSSIPLPAGTFDLEVRLAGTDTVVLPLPGITLAPNTNYTAYALGLVGGDPALQALLEIDAQTTARVRAVHLSPDAPVVDVLVNEAPAITELAFTQASAYAELPAADYGVQVVPTGQTKPAVIDAVLSLAGGTDYSVLAVDTLANIAPLVLVDDNDTDPEVARVRFVHASPNAPAVDVALADGPVLFGDVEFTENAGYLAVAPGTYDLEVRLAGTDTVVLPLPGLVFRPNTVSTAYAAGLVGGVPALQAALSLDAEGCTGDFNEDGAVDLHDLLRVLTDWSGTGTGADLDGSGQVGFSDLLQVIAGFGTCPG